MCTKAPADVCWLPSSFPFIFVAIGLWSNTGNFTIIVQSIFVGGAGLFSAAEVGQPEVAQESEIVAKLDSVVDDLDHNIE